MTGKLKQTAAQFAFHCLLDVFAANRLGIRYLILPSTHHRVCVVAQPSSAHSLNSVR
ncbi:hypothetical protein FORC54_3203 [Vibrio vulnificus]|nr:hypothetical protein FORC54_3203 [Vibrio vulnificus]